LNSRKRVDLHPNTALNIEPTTDSLLHLAPYRDIAAEVADRLSAGDVDVLVASAGVANAIAAELLKVRPNGAA
jgi:hypothetical protein